jgi:hypothetical protein
MLQQGLLQCLQDSKILSYGDSQFNMLGLHCHHTGSVAWDLIMHAGVAVVSLATFAAFADVSTLFNWHS